MKANPEPIIHSLRWMLRHAVRKVRIRALRVDKWEMWCPGPDPKLCFIKERLDGVLPETRARAGNHHLRARIISAALRHHYKM
jgi:hypothetical protein